MVCAHEKHHLAALKELEGTSIFNMGGKEVGKISQLIVDKECGRISYAVVDFCGFMCSKTSKHMVPWNSLLYNRDKDQYITKITDNEVESAPQIPDNFIESREWEKAIHEHYHTTPLASY